MDYEQESDEKEKEERDICRGMRLRRRALSRRSHCP